MEALKKFDLIELLKRQALVDEKFNEKRTVRKMNAARIEIAYKCEVGELAQELKAKWNYWKNTTKQVNKRFVLEELSDCLHFLLSYCNLKFCEDEIYDMQKSIDAFLDEPVFTSLERALVDLSKFQEEFLFEDEFDAIFTIINYVGAEVEEFLKVHHEVWERNMEIRTQEGY